jgi:hypothetical protein
MIDFNGGPMDGSASVDREINAGDSLSFREFVVMIVGVTSNYRYNKGHHFHIPSPGWLARTVVREASGFGVQHTFEYEIVDRLEGNDELLVVAQFVRQWPDRADADHASSATPEKE